MTSYCAPQSNAYRISTAVWARPAAAVSWGSLAFGKGSDLRSTSIHNNGVSYVLYNSVLYCLSQCDAALRCVTIIECILSLGADDVLGPLHLVGRKLQLHKFESYVQHLLRVKLILHWKLFQPYYIITSIHIIIVWDICTSASLWELEGITSRSRQRRHFCNAPYTAAEPVMIAICLGSSSSNGPLQT